MGGCANIPVCSYVFLIINGCGCVANNRDGASGMPCSTDATWWRPVELLKCRVRIPHKIFTDFYRFLPLLYRFLSFFYHFFYRFLQFFTIFCDFLQFFYKFFISFYQVCAKFFTSFYQFLLVFTSFYQFLPIFKFVF